MLVEPVKIARTYAAAADHFDRPAVSFWDRWGAETVRRLGLAPGSSVLDLCCGAGASAIPAARAVAPGGAVLGVDLAAPLLALAQARAAREGLTNVRFRRGDATRTELSEGTFDAVVCVFGVFFAPDMPAFVGEMWRLVRPGGTLAITTWGPAWCEPAAGAFWRAVQAIEPSLSAPVSPWERITSPGSLVEVFMSGGVPNATAEAQAAEHRLGRPDAFWDVVLGSGLRGTLDALAPDQRDRVRERVLSELRARTITTVRNDVVFGIAERTLITPQPSH